MNDKTNGDARNCPPMTKEEKKALKQYDVILATRNFELELFWKRSLFFWGFIATTFAGYIALSKGICGPGDNGYNWLGHFLVTLFGFICSCAWVLVNIGGKYWQKNWENFLESRENGITGELFQVRHLNNKGEPSFSPSRTTIFLSKVTAGIWGVLLVSFPIQSKLCGFTSFGKFIDDILCLRLIAVVVLLISVVFVVVYMRRNLRSNENVKYIE